MREVAISCIFCILPGSFVIVFVGMPRSKKMYYVSELAAWMKAYGKHTVRKELSLHLATVGPRAKEFKMQFARDAVAEAAANTFAKVQADCMSLQLGIYTCIEERVYERMCKEIMDNGVMERLQKHEADMNLLTDTMRDLMKDVGDAQNNMWTAMHDLIDGLNQISRDMLAMQVEIEALESRLENSRIN